MTMMFAPSFPYRLPSGKILVLPQQGSEKSDPQQARKDAAPGGAGGGTKTGGDKSTTQGTEQAPGGKTDPFGGCQSTLLLFVPFLVLMYFMMIRPQQKQEKVRRQMLADVKKGDQIVTSGGIHGQIAAMDDHTVTIKFGSGEGNRMKIDRSAIGRVMPKGGDKQEAS